jgi:hypothetical protein
MAVHLTQGMTLTLPALPADLDVVYTPDVLLETPYQAALLAHADFAEACEGGFESYFEELVTFDDEREVEVFIKRENSWEEIVAYLEDNVCTPDDLWAPTSLATKVGFCHGWLSALALFDLAEAQRGVVVLTMLAQQRANRRSMKRGH